MKKYLGFAMMAAMMSFAQEPIKENKLQEFIPKKDPKKLIPKGCNEYVFRYKYKEFKCIASSQKQADKKFEKWKLTIK
ncbi:MAG: hypothetical protein V4666_08475 [Bacteroidota bacterium]